MIFTTRQMTQGAIIAAAYLVLTMFFLPVSFGPIQFRVSEALMLLAAITPTAIPGLFVGCILANLLGGGLGIIDIIFGSLATLIAAYLTYWLFRKLTGSSSRLKILLLPLPTILVNGVIVGFYLPFLIPEMMDKADTFGLVFLLSAGSVMLGETVVTYGLGIPLFMGIKRTRLFRHEEGSL